MRLLTPTWRILVLALFALLLRPADGLSFPLPVAQETHLETLHLPFFYAVPEDHFLPLPEARNWSAPFVIVRPENHTEMPVGLRIYLIPEKAREAEPLLTSKLLARDALVRDGDVLLSYRPEWAGTGPYPNIQLGISHAGLAFVSPPYVYNIDMPLSFAGRLDNADHYLKLQVFHILRPRITALERKILAAWAQRFKGRREQLAFNTDYNSPNYRTRKMAFLNDFVEIGLGTPGIQLKMYCSEFAWSLLSLRDLDPAQSATRKPDPTSGLRFGPRDFHWLFPPLPTLSNPSRPGLAEGPLAILDRLNLTPEQRLAAVDKIFEGGDISNMSEGHKAMVAQTRALMDTFVRPYYELHADPTRTITSPAAAAACAPFAKASTAEQQLAALRMCTNRAIPVNYSPTSFMVNALWNDQAKRLIDYVATVAYVDDGTYAKAKRLYDFYVKSGGKYPPEAP